MTVSDTLRELFQYEGWADREVLQCVAEHGAWIDRELQERLHHAHVVQRVFLRLLKGEPPDIDELETPFSAIDTFRQSHTRYQDAMRMFVEPLTDAKLERPVSVPWFKGKEFTVGQILKQVVMHSQHHRGQNATRLKQMGHTPPTFDYIVWLAKERPQ